MADRKSTRKGSVTLPVEAGSEEKVMELAAQWGADAIRDSDGTRLSTEMLGMDFLVYSTLCIARADQEWASGHRDQLHQKFLVSAPVCAQSSRVEIDPMVSFFRDKYVLDAHHDPKEHWEVINRTTGETLEASSWDFDPSTGKVLIHSAKPFHEYTVNFLVFQIWDTTSMYNHIQNQWDGPHVMSVDPYHKETYQHLMEYFEQWLKAHPDTDVVRFTSLAYHFAVDSDQGGTDRFRDWVGYQDTVNIEALKDFEREFGYPLRSEDFVDQGYYNATSRVPSQHYLDWMAFVHRFVVRFGRELVDRVHSAKKKAALFWGDHWIGTEPYSPGYQEMGFDINIGACEDGVALRRLADAPGPQIKEARLYPYFFPDVFCPEGDPVGESISNWVKIRRALLRRSIDRIGYGGYVSLATEFPDFLKHVAHLCHEFRTIKDWSEGTGSYKAPIKVAVVNAWGKPRSWINSFGSAQKFLDKRPDVTQVAGTNLLECLAGLPVEVEFLGLGDIAEEGIPEGVDVIINDGDAETAWSGGQLWADPKVISRVRQWIHEGGGFIGCRGPSAYPHQGRYFQLADVMGVEKETGQGLQASATRVPPCQSHFILENNLGMIDFGSGESYVYPCHESTRNLASSEGHVLMAVRGYGQGRSIYLAGLPYSLENARLLLRSIFWAAGKEEELMKWFCVNPLTDCAAYPDAGVFVVVNNNDGDQNTVVHGAQGETLEILLKPFESRWFQIKRV